VTATPMELPAFLPLAFLGAFLGLDVVSFAQAMVSRPLVAATLAGWVAGDAGAGFLVAAILELIAVETLPVGASRYPGWGSASVVGGALAGMASVAAAGETPGGALCLAVFAALLTAWVSGGSMVLVRKLNGRLARRSLERVAAGDGGTVHRLQLTGLGADFVRGLIITTVGLLVFTPALEVAIRSWGTDLRLSRAVVVGAGAMVAAGAVWKLFHAVPRARWLFIGGLAVGLAALNFV
jgi:mannose/fructose/N-acetylgalactosamine-specific phosphotransferase system component IIC